MINTELHYFVAKTYEGNLNKPKRIQKEKHSSRGDLISLPSQYP